MKYKENIKILHKVKYIENLKPFYLDFDFELGQKDLKGMGSFRLWWTTEAEMNQIQNHKRSNLKSKCFRVMFLIYKHIFPGKFCENILERYSEVVVGWFCFWQTILHTLQGRLGNCIEKTIYCENYEIYFHVVTKIYQTAQRNICSYVLRYF